MDINTLVKAAADQGLPALKELFNKLPKEDALKGIGVLAILGVAQTAFIAIVEIVKGKQA